MTASSDLTSTTSKWSFSNIGNKLLASDQTNAATCSDSAHNSAPTTDVNNTRSEESSQQGSVSLCLIYKKKKMAAAGYNSSTGQMHLIESVPENARLCTSILTLRSFLPAVVVVPSSGAKKFVKALKDKLEGDRLFRNCRFECLSSRYCSYSSARKIILESPMWEGFYNFQTEDAKKSAIVNNINLNDERLVCAVGGLLHHTWTDCLQFQSSYRSVSIISVQQLKLNNRLWVDNESLRTLQIFNPIEHPSPFNWSVNMDEGKSIFGLFKRHCSKVGLTRLKTILANPTNCRFTLAKRHEVISFYLDKKNRRTVESLQTSASQMYSSTSVMGCLSSPTLQGSQWKHIYRHIYYTVSYAEVCRSHECLSALFRELGSNIVDTVYSMTHNIEQVVDLANIENTDTFVVKYGFHLPLDAAKEKFSRIKVAMEKVTPYEFDVVPSYVTNIQMMYFPEIKFLLTIPFWTPDLTEENLQLPDLELQFVLNKIAYYKSRRCYELDELLGDTYTDILNEEFLIIQSLKNYLKSHMHLIVNLSYLIAEIECLFSMARVAREEHYTMPQLLNDSVIEVKSCWYPQLGMSSSHIITNDVVSSTDTSLVKLVYGPNASGKSIYLKQVGLVMYLVHVGSFVPAVSAKVGLLDQIIVRKAQEESIISMSSSMMSELRKLQIAVVASGRNTLVILDEVAKCSTEMDCVGILVSTVNYFLSLGSECPHVLVSTHLSGVNEFVNDANNLVELLSMEYTVAKGDIVFLYKVLRGRSDGSFVFETIENYDFAKPLIDSARTVLQAVRTGDNLLPYCNSRVQRSYQYFSFIRKFIGLDIAKPGYLEKLQGKVQQYYEKMS